MWVDLRRWWLWAGSTSGGGGWRCRDYGSCGSTSGTEAMAAASQPQVATAATDRPGAVQRWYLDSEWRWQHHDRERPRWRASFLPHPTAALEALTPPPFDGTDRG
jgi:hypothetical protein